MEQLSNKKIDELDEESEHIKEVLGQKPKWILRWGITLVLFFFSIILMLSNVVKYPDIIESKITITTPIPPSSVIAQVSGKLSSILIENNAQVEANQLLAIIESTANPEDIFYLKQNISHFDNISKLDTEKKLVLGDLQNSYSIFLRRLEDLRFFEESFPIEKEINAALLQQNNYKNLLNRQIAQREIYLSELSLAQAEYNRNKNLYTNKVLSDKEFEDVEIKWLNSQRKFEELQTNIIKTKIELSALDKTLTQLKVQNEEKIIQLNIALKEAYEILLSDLAKWEIKYLLKSPIKGRVSLFAFWTGNQYVKDEDEVMVIVPKTNQEVIGKVLMPARNAGKVKVGQKVRVHVANYPSREYGVVFGNVSSISGVPRNNSYAIEVHFPLGLSTTYKKHLPLMQEMNGEAEIITDDLSLLERILYQFRDIMTNRI